MDAYPELRTRYDLNLTAEDLTKGKVGDSYDCMAVRKIAKTIPDASGIRVDTQSVTFSVPYKEELVRLSYFTPPTLQHYVILFDAGDELYPFRCRLQNPVVTTRVKKAKAATKANDSQTSLKRQAIEAGATPEEAKAIASKAYRESMQAAFQTAHAVHQELEAQGVEDAVEKAAEAAGLLVAKPGNPSNNNPDPLFATIDRRVEPGKRPPLPKVFKRRRRSYGQRALRINWPIDPVTGDRIKPDVTRMV